MVRGNASTLQISSHAIWQLASTPVDGDINVTSPCHCCYSTCPLDCILVWLSTLKNKHFYTNITPRITAPPYTFHCLLFSPTNTFMLFMEAKEIIDVELGLRCGPGSVVGISDWLRAGRYGDRILVEARFSAPVQTGPGAHPASCTMGTGSFPRVKSGRGVTLTPHPLLVPLVLKE